jgi:hypothetical protein
MRAGKSVAYISDAGTPGISDPGARLVGAARAGQVPIVPIPGASAVATAMSVSGLEGPGCSSASCRPGLPPVARPWTICLTITRPDDWHLHLRDGDMLAAVLPDTARQFGRAIVMPNLKPPVTTAADARPTTTASSPPCRARHRLRRR